MADKRKPGIIIQRGILGPASGSTAGISFSKSGKVQKHTSLSKFPGEKKKFKICFKKNPDGKIVCHILTTWNCRTAWDVVLKYFPEAVFISCHEI